MAVIRDYVPSGENLTDEEKARYEKARQLIAGGVIHDYVPTEPAAPRRTIEEVEAEAHQRAQERERRALRDEFLAAKERLRNMSVAEAVMYIRELPIGIMELYLLAEESTAGRQGILANFPEVDPKTRSTYGVSKPEPQKVKVAATTVEE